MRIFMQGMNHHPCHQKINQKNRSSLGSFLLHPCSIKVMTPLPNNTLRRQQHSSSGRRGSSGSLWYQSNDQFMDILLLDAAGRRVDDGSESDSASDACASLVETPAMHAAAAAAETSRELCISQDAMDVSAPFA